MAKKAIQVLREMEGRDIAHIQCLYCMDTRHCRICNGVGSTPGAVNGRLTPIVCYDCGGDKRCRHCSLKQKVKKSA